MGDDGDSFAKIAKDVAALLYGEPNAALSSKTELRFGNKGSLSVDLQKGTFFDHSQNEGGGVLWAIKSVQGYDTPAAMSWLEEQGLIDPKEQRPTGQAKRQKPAQRGNDAPPPYADGDPGPQPDRDSGGAQSPQMRTVASWDYKDADGNLLFQVLRMEDGTISKDGKPAKTYRQRRPDASKPSGWDWSTKGMQMVPYRLPELLQAIKEKLVVYVVEGEKAADRLIAAGIPATTNARGAGKWTSDLNPYFAGARVVVMPDNDPQATFPDGRPKFHDNGQPILPGQDHARSVAWQISRHAKQVKYLELPDLPLKGDVVDWLDAGNDTDRLYDLTDAAPVFNAAAEFSSSFGAIPWADLDKPGMEHEWLIKGLVTRHEVAMIAGPSRSGKSFLVLDLAMAVARGLPWFGRKTRKGGVIYQAGEGARGLTNRLKAYRDQNNLELSDPIPFVLLPGRLNLYESEDHTEKFIAEVLHWRETFDVPLELIVIDTWAKATSGANENDGKDVSQILDRCARINRETGAAVMIVHHMNADGGKVRGHTSILGNLDSVILVRQLQDTHDGSGRQVREAKVDKNKDGPDGDSFKFVLRGVTIGQDEDGDDVTSCVVRQPDGAGTEQTQAERPNITGAEGVLLRAIEKAIRERGGPPPVAEGLPDGADSVVEWKAVSEAYDLLSFDHASTDGETEEEKTKRLQNRRKTLSRCGETLLKKAIIGKQGSWVWILNARRVRGYRSSFETIPGGPPPDRGAPPPEPDNLIPARDWSAEDLF
jgi:AAA domain